MSSDSIAQETLRPLLFLVHQKTAQRYPLLGDFIIGRSDGHLVINNDPKLSSKHCLIRSTPSGFAIYDLKSRTGVVINGSPLPRGKACLLRSGAVITVGDQKFIVETEAQAAVEAEVQAQAEAIAATLAEAEAKAEAEAEQREGTTIAHVFDEGTAVQPAPPAWESGAHSDSPFASPEDRDTVYTAHPALPENNLITATQNQAITSTTQTQRVPVGGGYITSSNKKSPRVRISPPTKRFLITAGAMSLLAVLIYLASPLLKNLRSSGRGDSNPSDLSQLATKPTLESLIVHLHETASRLNQLNAAIEAQTIVESQSLYVLRKDLIPRFASIQTQLQTLVPQQPRPEEVTKLNFQRTLARTLLAQVTAMANFIETKETRYSVELDQLHGEVQRLNLQNAKAIEQPDTSKRQPTSAAE